jgi:hypothetical protein
MSPTEIIIGGGVAMIAVKESFALVRSFVPKTPQLTERDLKQQSYQDDMKNLLTGTLKVLEKLSDKQEETKKEVNDIVHIQQGSHKRIAHIESGVDVLKGVITKDFIRESMKLGFREFCPKTAREA